MRNSQVKLVAVLLVALVCLLGVVAMLENPASTPPTTTEPSTSVTTTPPTTTAPPQTTVPTTPPTTLPPVTEPDWTTVPEDRVITAQKAFIYDCDTKEFIHTIGDLEEPLYPASITKLVTAFTILQYLSADEELTVGDELDLVPWDSSVAGLQKGDVLTVDRLIEGMMLPSGNDAANTLAAAAGRLIAEDDSLSASAAIAVFMKEMNRTAKAYGMSDSHFVTPDGYHDPDHYTTMADMAVLGRRVLGMPEILKYTGLTADQIPLDEERILEGKNTNALIHPESEFYCSAAVGLKTGQHSAAGKCLLSAFQFNGRTVVIGVFGCADDPDRFADTLQLLQMCT